MELWEDFITRLKTLVEIIIVSLTNLKIVYEKKIMKSSFIQEILVKFAVKVDIFIHHKGQFLSPNSRLAESKTMNIS